jgi:hypothetical protein
MKTSAPEPRTDLKGMWSGRAAGESSTIAMIGI